MGIGSIMQQITVQISQQVEIVVFRVNFVHQDFKSTKKLSREELEGRYHVLTKRGLECGLVISINCDNLCCFVNKYKHHHRISHLLDDLSR